MDKMKTLKKTLDTYQLIVKEVSEKMYLPLNEEGIEELFALMNLIQYSKVDELLASLKASVFKTNNNPVLISSKINKAEKDFQKIIHEVYIISIHLSSFKRKKKSLIKLSPPPKEIYKLPNLTCLDVEMRNAIKSFKNENLPIVLGKMPDHSMKIVDLTKMPHLLIAGQTGSGKSVFLNSLIISLLFAKNCKLALVDPKRVEFSFYKDLSQLWNPVVTDLEKSENLFERLINEMENRYKILENTGFRNLEAYNKEAKNKLPYIVVVIDELADLMMVTGYELKDQITRLAQLARAVGIHMVMATQRPVVEIITGLIKANMPSRIAFKVASKQDSRIILDRNGAELLKGNGDMLFLEKGELVRCQGLWISEEEIKNIT